MQDFISLDSFHLIIHFYHTLATTCTTLNEELQILTGPIPTFTGLIQFLLDLSHGPIYFTKTDFLCHCSFGSLIIQHFTVTIEIAVSCQQSSKLEYPLQSSEKVALNLCSQDNTSPILPLMLAVLL